MASIFESPELIGAFIGEVEEQLQLLENNVVELEKTVAQQRWSRNYSVRHIP